MSRLSQRMQNLSQRLQQTRVYQTARKLYALIYLLETLLEAFLPTILALVLTLLLAACLYNGWLSGFSDPLRDILSPWTARESVRSFWALRWGFSTIGVAATWLVPLFLIVWVNWILAVNRIGQIRQLYAGGLDLDRVLAAKFERQPAPDDPKRQGLLSRVTGVGSPQMRFFRLVVLTWIWGAFPLGIALAILKWQQAHLPADHVDMHTFAVVGTVTLLALVVVSISQWRLGALTEVGWTLSLLPLIPLLLIGVSLFWSRFPFDRGKSALLNDHSAQHPPVRYYQLLKPITRNIEFDTNHIPIDFRQPGHNDKGPLVILCAGGGGSRAALFTAGVLSRIWWEPLTNSNQDLDATTLRRIGNLAGVPEFRWLGANPNSSNWQLYPGRLLLLRCDVLGGVSGGSLAAAYFDDSLYQLLKDPAATGCAVGPGVSPELQRFAALSRFFEPQALTKHFDDLIERPRVTWQGMQEPPKSLQQFFANLPSSDRQPVMTNYCNQHQQDFEANPFINAMRQDFLGATIAGFFEPSQGRGAGIEEFWRQQFKWDRYCQPGQTRTLADLYDMEKAGSLPSLLLNATITRTGTRLAITNLGPSEFQVTHGKFGPDQDRAWLAEQTKLERKTDHNRPTNVARYDPLPEQINTLNELDPNYNITLMDGVRASGNFPYGFPLMRLQRRGWYESSLHQVVDLTKGMEDYGLPIRDGNDDILQITDGGLVDNLGIDSVMALLEANQEAIKQRGVLILVIDNDFLQTDQRPSVSRLWDPRTWWDEAQEASNAQWRAGFDQGADLYALYVAKLESLFGTRLNAVPGTPLDPKSRKPHPYILGYTSPKCALFQIRAGENESDQIPTSWHLASTMRATLYSEICRKQQREAIIQAAAWLANPNSPSENSLPFPLE